MKYGRFENKNGEVFFGRVVKDEVIKMTDFLGEETCRVFPLREVQILTPSLPSKIVCVGLNYKTHATEMNMEIPKYPVLFLKPSTGALAHREKIVRPESGMRVDYEAELALVVAKNVKNIDADQAKDCIAGYTCLNDVTARDIQSLDGQWTRAKGFDGFAPFGPFIESEFDPSDKGISAVLNGEIVQSSRTSDMIFSPEFLLSFVSKVMTLKAGDVISTGTPSGIGPMKDGDEIEIRIEGLEPLSNFIGK